MSNQKQTQERPVIIEEIYLMMIKSLINQCLKDVTIAKAALIEAIRDDMQDKLDDLRDENSVSAKNAHTIEELQKGYIVKDWWERGIK